MDQTDQHVFYHLYDLGTKVNLKLERNSRGYNWEVTVLNAKTIDEAIQIIQDAEAKMVSLYNKGSDNLS